MLYVVVALLIAAAVAENQYEERLIEGETTTAAAAYAWGLALPAVGAYFALRLARLHRRAVRFWIVVGWLLALAILWVIAQAADRPVPIWLFLGVWVAAAVPAGMTIAIFRNPPAAPVRAPSGRGKKSGSVPAPAPPAGKARVGRNPPPVIGAGIIGARPRGAPASTIGAGTATGLAIAPRRAMQPPPGRVPPAVAALLSSNTHTVSEIILTELGSAPPEGRRAFTLEAILERVIRDWWQNGNEDALTQDDVADIQSFIALGSAIAQSVSTGDTETIYRCLLNALLDDWLIAWNADRPGPPQR
jgi:hypothetical protein